jgi:glycine cleavage system H protein
MPEFLATTVDKFTFRVATDRAYTADGVWLQTLDGRRVRIGVTDYLQQHSGDVAFVSAKAPGTRLALDQEFAALETIKVNLSLPSPVAGAVVEVNDALESAPERVNQDPYGAGWIAVIEAADWDKDRARLLDSGAYFSVMQAQVEAEIGHS